jgi:hypothetical protein
MSGQRRLLSHYEVLGVPIGAGIDHIRDSYRLLGKRNATTEVAFRILTDPAKRLEYDSWLRRGGKPEAGSPAVRAGEEQDWGRRGRERCSCGKILGVDDEWLCHDCTGKLNYLVVFDMLGGRIVHDSDPSVIGLAIEAPTSFGPFTIEEAVAFLKEKNDTRNR